MKLPKYTPFLVLIAGGLFLWILISYSIRKAEENTTSQIRTALAPKKTEDPAESARLKREAEEAAASALQKRCTEDLPVLLAAVRKELDLGDPRMADARISLCEKISKDPAYLAMRRTVANALKVHVAKVVATAAANEKAEKARKRKEGVSIGMSKQDVLDSSWGKPQHVNRTTTARGVREQWVYGLRSYLYFDDNTLTAIQN